MVDVSPSGHDRGDHRQHLATRKRASDPTHQSHQLVHQLLQTEANHEGGRHDQPGVSDQGGLVEGHRDAVKTAR
jgi:hypothetical protein